MTVVSFQKAKEERTPHFAGEATCLHCRETWAAVAPVGTQELECPECGLMRGVWSYNFGPGEGDAVLTCDCGCEHLSAYKRKGHMRVKCMACGSDLTDVFYDG